MAPTSESVRLSAFIAARVILFHRLNRTVLGSHRVPFKRGEVMQDNDLPFDKSRSVALTRRSFAALSLTAGAAAAMAADAVQETDIVIPMADGACDAALFQPAGTGAWPGCLIFTDAL